MYELSRMILGTAQIGMKYGIANRTGKPEEKQAFEILDYAWDKGITTFDTAAVYGDSEEIIGKWISCHKINPFVITKIPHFGKGKKLTSRQVRKFIIDQTDASLRRLHLENVWGLLLHSLESFSYYREGIILAFDELKKKRVIHHCGYSAYHPKDILDNCSNAVFDIFQLPINLFQNQCTIDSAFDACFNGPKRRLFARSIFLQGLFFLQSDIAEKKVPGSGVYIKKLHNISRKSGIPVNRIAFCFVRNQPIVSSVVIGSETKEQVKENIMLLNKGDIPPEVYKDLYSAFQSIPETVSDPRKWQVS